MGKEILFPIWIPEMTLQKHHLWLLPLCQLHRCWSTHFSVSQLLWYSRFLDFRSLWNSFLFLIVPVWRHISCYGKTASNTDVENNKKKELKGEINNILKNKKLDWCFLLVKIRNTLEMSFIWNCAYILCHFQGDHIYVLFLYKSVIHLLTVIFTWKRKSHGCVSNYLLISHASYCYYVYSR
jgi:hypothetical protein